MSDIQPVAQEFRRRRGQTTFLPISHTWMLIMRNTAFLGTAAALLISVAPVSAGNDFDALLGDLTFGDTPAASEALTLDEAAKKTADTLKSAPAKAADTLTMPPSVETIAAPTPEPMAQSIVQGPITQSPVSQAPLAQAPLAPAPMQNGYVNFGQAFAAQDCDSCAGGCDNGYCGGPQGGIVSGGCASGRCGSGHHQECETCIPYQKPSLPSSSFIQYFRSDACNVNVWDGFRNRCCSASKHTRGECDCFEKKRLSCLDCETVVYDVAPCEPRVCAVPSTTTRSKRFFNFTKRDACDDPAENCDTAKPGCDATVGTCD